MEYMYFYSNFVRKYKFIVYKIRIEMLMNNFLVSTILALVNNIFELLNKVIFKKEPLYFKRLILLFLFVFVLIMTAYFGVTFVEQIGDAIFKN